MSDTSEPMPKKIKILFAVGRFSVGGAEKLLVRHLGVLDKEKFIPSVITIFTEQEDTFATETHINHCFAFRSTFDLPAFFRLWSYLRVEKFDVVVTHLFTANLLVRLAAAFARVPVIIAFEHNIYPQKHRWQIVMDRLLSRYTDLVVTSSEVTKRFTAKQESIPLEKFLTLYIPPLLEKREPRDEMAVRSELHIPANAPVVLTVSRLIADKGHSFLLDAAKQVLKVFPEVVFLVVGWGPEQENLEKQAMELGIEQSLRLPGRMDIQDVLPLAEAYVDPAVSTDLPVALMEAMREGKAIVATNIGEIPAFVQDGRTGIVVEPKDEAVLADGVMRLLADASLREKLGTAAKEKVRSLSLEQYGKQFEEEIVRLLSLKKK